MLLFHFFFFNDTATTEIYTLSLHDALPICNQNEPVVAGHRVCRLLRRAALQRRGQGCHETRAPGPRSEEHTSELQSQSNLVCRLLLEKKKNKNCKKVHRKVQRQ